MGWLQALLAPRWQRHTVQRRTLARGCGSAPIVSWLEAPLPDPTTPAEQAPLLAIDLELTGLDAQSDRILSVGWVPIDGGRIRIAGAHRDLVATSSGVGQSARVHGIRDCEVREATPLVTILEALAAALRGRVPVFHHAPLDVAFLDRAMGEVFGVRFPGPVIDTLALERQRRARREQAVSPGDLRLPALRARYGLPAATAHDALADAIATAELLLAMLAGRDRSLGDLVA